MDLEQEEIKNNGQSSSDLHNRIRGYSSMTQKEYQKQFDQPPKLMKLKPIKESFEEFEGFSLGSPVKKKYDPQIKLDKVQGNVISIKELEQENLPDEEQEIVNELPSNEEQKSKTAVAQVRIRSQSDDISLSNSIYSFMNRKK